MAEKIFFASRLPFSSSDHLTTYDPATNQIAYVFPTDGIRPPNQPHSVEQLMVAAGGGDNGFDRIYFSGRTTAFSGTSQVWDTDGSAAGTEVHTNFTGFDPFFLFTLNDDLFFDKDDATQDTGSELLITDGATGNTGLFKDINPGPDGSFPLNAVFAGDKVFFVADDGSHGFELWVTFGTSATTYLVKDLNPGEGPAGIQQLLYDANSGLLYFRAGSIYRSDGTQQGTQPITVEQTQGGAFYDGADQLVGLTATGALYEGSRTDTNAFDSVNHNAFGLWRATPGQGAQLIYSRIDVTGSGVTTANGLIYFLAQALDAPASQEGVDLWFSNGTASVTASLHTGLEFSGGLRGAALNDTLFFVAQDPDDPNNVPQLYKVAGNGAIVALTSFTGANNVQSINGFQAIGDHLYFFVRQSFTNLYRVDDTANGNVELVAQDVVEFAGIIGANVAVGLPVNGDDNDNVLQGTSAHETMDGKGGNDTIRGDGGSDTMFGGDGVDYLAGGLGNDTMYGGAEGDALHGEDGNDVIYGGFGDDVLIGLTGDDTLYGTDGNDTLIGDDGTETLVAGRDVLYGGPGADQIYGYIGQDRLYGGTEGDFLSGGAGDDILNGGDGDDAIHGEDGNNIGNGDNGNDVLVGFDGDDTFNGGNDHDTLIGNGGDDRLNGDDGNDQIFGYGGTDILEGGDGADFLAGGDNAAGDLRRDQLYGGAGGDVLDGEAGDDDLYGGDDGDNLNGGEGTDFLSGGAGNDGLLGWDGNDTLNGGAGNDFLIGDRADGTGNRGNDTFVFRNGTGNDNVADFQAGAGTTVGVGDVIDIRDFGFADFAAVLAAATDLPGGIYIALDADDAIFLEGLTKAQLAADDFLLA